MSEHENGNVDAIDSAHTEMKRLDAIVEVCAVYAERSFKASQNSQHAIERMEEVLKNVMRAIKRISDDQLEMRSGIPANWMDRFGLIMIVSALSSVVASLVTVLMFRLAR